MLARRADLTSTQIACVFECGFGVLARNEQDLITVFSENNFDPVLVSKFMCEKGLVTPRTRTGEPVAVA